MKKIIIVFCILFTVVIGCSVNRSENTGEVKPNKQTSIESEEKKLLVNLNDIKLLLFEPSPLSHKPNHKLDPNNSKDIVVISKLVNWLNISKLTKDDEPAYGKQGYPPSLKIVLKNGNSVFVEPAFKIEGEILFEIDSQSKILKRLRLQSPQLYDWLIDDWQNDIKPTSENNIKH